MEATASVAAAILLGLLFAGSAKCLLAAISELWVSAKSRLSTFIVMVLYHKNRLSI
jgi:hypothetical protein